MRLLPTAGIRSVAFRTLCLGPLLAVMLGGGMALAQTPAVGTAPDPATDAQAAAPEMVNGDLPPLPPGKSTVIGGSIHDVDPVRDQFSLHIFGGHPMKILFDERTQLFRDGKKIPLRDLKSDEHASVETMLDGTKVFARSIHTLSKTPEGETQGQVLDYNASTGDLSVSDALTGDPVKLRVPGTTLFTRLGQAESPGGSASAADLVTGTLVSVQFQSNNTTRGVTSQIAILAKPGSTFAFSGNITFIDMHAQQMVLVDPRDDKSYKIAFDPAQFPASHSLHVGSSVAVTADFDGKRYVATAITLH